MPSASFVTEPVLPRVCEGERVPPGPVPSRAEGALRGETHCWPRLAHSGRSLADPILPHSPLPVLHSQKSPRLPAENRANASFGHFRPLGPKADPPPGSYGGKAFVSSCLLSALCVKKRYPPWPLPLSTPRTSPPTPSRSSSCPSSPSGGRSGRSDTCSRPLAWRPVACRGSPPRCPRACR